MKVISLIVLVLLSGCSLKIHSDPDNKEVEVGPPIKTESDKVKSFKKRYADAIEFCESVYDNEMRIEFCIDDYLRETE